jgi:hypothetical protein
MHKCVLIKTASQRLVAGGLVLQVQLQILHLRRPLVPFLNRLDVHGANVRMALFKQVHDQMAADKSAAAAHHNFAGTHNFEIKSSREN